MQKTTLVFDFDGTLADTMPVIFTVVNELATRFHFPTISKVEFQELRGKTPFETMRQLKIPILQIGSLVLAGQQAMTQYMREVPIIEGLAPVLVELRNRGYRFGIVTSNSKKNIEAFLEKHNILFFEFIYAQHNILGKHFTLKEMMKKEGLDPTEILYFGDEVRDISACRRAGLDICSVTWGWNTKKLIKSFEPTIIVDKPEEILKHVKTLRS